MNQIDIIVVAILDMIINISLVFIGCLLALKVFNKKKKEKDGNRP